MLNFILNIGCSMLSKTGMVCFFMKVALRGENSCYLNINTRKKTIGSIQLEDSGEPSQGNNSGTGIQWWNVS